MIDFKIMKIVRGRKRRGLWSLCLEKETLEKSCVHGYPGEHYWWSELNGSLGSG